jgi:hypothetical protein
MNKKCPSLTETYNKVIVTIESCKTKEQLEGAIRMADNFEFLYKKVGYPKILSYIINKTINKKSITCQ